MKLLTNNTKTDTELGPLTTNFFLNIIIEKFLKQYKNDAPFPSAPQASFCFFPTTRPCHAVTQVSGPPSPPQNPTVRPGLLLPQGAAADDATYHWEQGTETPDPGGDSWEGGCSGQETSFSGSPWPRDILLRVTMAEGHPSRGPQVEKQERALCAQDAHMHVSF